MRIKVTQEHWDRGVEAMNAGGEPRVCCVLAQALEDAGVKHTGVGYSAVTLGQYPQYKHVILPPNAVEVRQAFDSDWMASSPVVPPLPIEFDLDVPESAPVGIPLGPSREGA